MRSPRVDEPKPTLRVGVIGGGTAGYFAALAVKAHVPAAEVTLVASSAIPIIGVGEATTSLMPPFLHRRLGIDPRELFARVKPTFKLGIRFEWGLPGADAHFNYPFHATHPFEAVAYDGDLRTQSLLSLLMDDGLAPVVRGPEGQVLSLLASLKFAYHLDNGPFVAFLRETAIVRGIRHEDLAVDEIVRAPDGDGLRAVRGEGRELAFDVFVDATGFRSLLVGGALGSPFQSFASSLFCDRALVARVPQGDAIRPYTTAETMNHGWCWRIPVVGEDHRGYVFSSAFASDDEAAAELRAKNPGAEAPHLVRFRSGRLRDFWFGNAFAIGNAYGFVEPLESTALHMVIVSVGFLLAGLDTLLQGGDVEAARARANREVGERWDYLRWFLALHYKWNRRLDTPFWQAARREVDLSGFDPLLAAYRADPTSVLERGERAHPGSASTFSPLPMLLGQRVPTDAQPRLSRTRDAWVREVAGFERVRRWALPQREALAILAARPELLDDLTRSPRSWLAGPEAIALPRLIGPQVT